MADAQHRSKNIYLYLGSDSLSKNDFKRFISRRLFQQVSTHERHLPAFNIAVAKLAPDPIKALV